VCTLVLIGVRADGRKELIALTDGHRESTESWADLLRDARRRGMRAPVLAVGDGALGFWAALREVFPETAEQRDWVHKLANVLDALPKSAQPAAHAALVEIRDAEDKPHAQAAMKLFADTFTAKFPKAVAKITGDAEQLLAFYDLPRRALDPSQDLEPDRIDLRHGAATHQDHHRPWLPRRRTGHGLPAHPRRSGTLAGAQRTASGRTRACRSEVREGSPGRTTR
jgi:hypothetical protein